MISHPTGNRHAPCATCNVRHRPDRACTVDPQTSPGAGDGVYHDAPYLKKYGA